MGIPNVDATTCELLIAFDLNIERKEPSHLLSVQGVRQLASMEVVERATTPDEVKEVASHPPPKVTIISQPPYSGCFVVWLRRTLRLTISGKTFASMRGGAQA